MKTALLIFPHQLFDDHPGLNDGPALVCLIEDTLFFGDPVYPASFHKQKLWYHRATMTRYAARLEARGNTVLYVDYEPRRQHLQDVLESLRSDGFEAVQFCDPVDFVLSKRICEGASKLGMDLRILDSPGFINTKEQNEEYRESKSRWFMADFYKFQRRRLGILISDGKPTGGQWSYDKENRKKVPKKLLSAMPTLQSVATDSIDEEARSYIEDRFENNPGSLERVLYPTSHEAASTWLDTFLDSRIEHFGRYEDAIVKGESWLWHGVLTPMMNTGLLTPMEVVRRTLAFADKNDVPLNSLEGFLRQIIGWREFMRATYEDLGVTMRTTNHWGHTRPMPRCFYVGDTGLEPLDDVIERLQSRAYCHHIERLMVLGGFMFLCEIDPKHIYRWFMEMFIDSYDWVMVPNVYAMSQNADGGLITTKPYFSGSSYILKMSNYKRGDWSDIWDGLYWRWIYNHRKELAKNPRWAMMCSMAERMDSSKMESHLARANSYLDSLSD